MGVEAKDLSQCSTRMCLVVSQSHHRQANSVPGAESLPKPSGFCSAQHEDLTNTESGRFPVAKSTNINQAVRF